MPEQLQRPKWTWESGEIRNIPEKPIREVKIPRECEMVVRVEGCEVMIMKWENLTEQERNFLSDGDEEWVAILPSGLSPEKWRESSVAQTISSSYIMGADGDGAEYLQADGSTYIVYSH